MDILKFFNGPLWILFECLVGPYLILHGNRLPSAVFGWPFIGGLMVIHIFLTTLVWVLGWVSLYSAKPKGDEGKRVIVF